MSMCACVRVCASTCVCLYSILRCSAPMGVRSQALHSPTGATRPQSVAQGRTYDPHACEFKSAANCTSAVHTKAAIEALCVGKSKCIIETAGLNQPDPCSGHHKRVAVLATGCSAMAPPKSKPTMTFTSSTGGGTLGYNNNMEDAGLDGSGKFIQNASSGPLVSRAYLPRLPACLPGLVSF